MFACTRVHPVWVFFQVCLLLMFASTCEWFVFVVFLVRVCYAPYVCLYLCACLCLPPNVLCLLVHMCACSFVRPCLNFHVCLLLLFFDVMPIHVVVSVFPTRHKGFMISINYHIVNFPEAWQWNKYSVICNAHLPRAFDLQFRFIGSFLAVCMFYRMTMALCFYLVTFAIIVLAFIWLTVKTKVSTLFSLSVNSCVPKSKCLLFLV